MSFEMFTSNILRCHSNTSMQMNSMLGVFFKLFRFSMFTHFHTFKFWVSLCAIISLSSLCVLPIPLFLCKRLNLCSSAAKRKMKKELMHILISVSMLLLYQNYWTCFHGGCISVFFLHLHCQLFSRMKCLGGYLQIFALTVLPHLCLMSSNFTVVWLLFLT